MAEIFDENVGPLVNLLDTEDAVLYLMPTMKMRFEAWQYLMRRLADWSKRS